MYNKTQNIEKVNKKMLIATVDIGSRSHVGYWRSWDGAQCKPFEFSNDRLGFDRFWGYVCGAKIKHNADEIMVGFEPTGSFGEPLVYYLKDKPVTVVYVNPKHTKRVKELSDNSPLKTDKKDPRVLADIIQLEHYLSVVVPTGICAELRELSGERERAIVERSCSYNRLYNKLYAVFPEFFAMVKDIRVQSIQYLLARYPLPEDIVKLGKKRLTRLLKHRSHGRFGESFCVRLYEAAKASVGVTEGSRATRDSIRYIIGQIAEHNRRIAELEEAMRRLLEEIPISRNILSIKGIGTVVAACIIGEVGNFETFPTQRSLIKFAGLNLYEVSSGKHRGVRRISKRGREYLRKTLYFAAMNTVRKNGIMHDYYIRLIESGMPRIKALIAVSRKLLGIIYALARKQENFVIEYSVHKAA
jgi:transposase